MDVDKKQLDRLEQADEVGCYGLVEGFARNLYTHNEFDASACSKSDGPFYCPDCKSDAVLRRCTQKRDHFAHSARLTPALGAGEGERHKACKEELCAALAARHPEGNWATERTIRARAEIGVPELRPDISGRIGETRIAIEVQNSAYTPALIGTKSRDYGRRKIALLWVVPLSGELGTEQFRPRLYERYLHSIYYGRTYYWWPGRGASLAPVHYATAKRYVAHREWTEEGAHCEGGGYETEYKIIKEPSFGPDLFIDKDFVRQDREEFVPENERKAVPACVLWHDNKPPWWS